MKITLKVWRQKDSADKGRFETYTLNNVSEHMSFLEMFDVLNEELIQKKEVPVAFEHDCREGICGACSMVINGRPHGPMQGTTTCQLHMRHFNDGDTIVVEPFRARAFPVLRDLVVDRSAFDRIIQSGGFISVNTGQAQDANSIPVNRDAAEASFNAPQFSAAGPDRVQAPRTGYGETNGRRGLRQLFERDGLRGGMPQGDFYKKHRQTESRLRRLGAGVGGEGVGDCRVMAAASYKPQAPSCDMIE